jgi:hypothetical protein
MSARIPIDLQESDLLRIHIILSRAKRLYGKTRAEITIMAFELLAKEIECVEEALGKQGRRLVTNS